MPLTNLRATGNVIGLDISRASGLPNGGKGVLYLGVTAATRTAATLQGNTVGFNAGDGVDLNNSSGVLVTGNFIGTDSSGTRLLANRENGVHLETTNPLQGLPTAPTSNNNVSRNLISNNLGQGVELQVQGAAPGSTVVPSPVTSNVIGGPTSDDHNTILGNQGSGVLFNGSNVNSNTALNNVIGSTVPGDPLNQGNRNGGVSLVSAGTANTLQGNTVAGNRNNGVLILDTDGTKLQGNFIGTDANGDTGLGNTNVGLFILDSNRTIVGNADASGKVLKGVSGNTVSGNASHGVVIFASPGKTGSTGNVLASNRIGVSPPGVSQTSNSLSNSLSGVLVINARGNLIGVADGGNVIAGNNSHGVYLIGAGGNSLTSNTIGTDEAGHTFLGNNGDGVFLVNSGSNHVINNVISANRYSGVEIHGSSVSNDVQLNTIGTLLPPPAGQTVNPLGNQLNGITVGGNADTNNNMINNGNVIVGNRGDGVFLDHVDSTMIQNNSIGTSVGQDVAAGNGLDGIDVLDSTGTKVWGNAIRFNTADGARVEAGSSYNDIGVPNSAKAKTTQNVIANNAGAGVELRSGSTGNRVAYNLIGLDTNGYAQPNLYGVYLNNVSNNTVGSATGFAGKGNVISGNTDYGVFLAGNDPSLATKSNFVENNEIGTNASGVFLNRPNSTLNSAARVDAQNVGVFALNSSTNMIVGNVVSGNRTAGVELFGALSQQNVLMNNTIGSDPSLSTFVAADSQADPAVYSDAHRQDNGVLINDAGHNRVGPGNHILANQAGVAVQGANATNNLITGDSIGSEAFKPGDQNTNGLGNFFGVYIQDTSNNFVSYNTIERNISVGVTVYGLTAQGNVVQSNNISSNGGYGFVDPKTGDVTTVSVNNPGAVIFGSGVFIDLSQNNVVGSGGQSGQPESTAQGNLITDNTQVGIYLYQGANGNLIRSNRIIGLQHPQGPWNGDYGILLYNSGNNVPFVAQQGPFANKISGNRIADFREYTGPGSALPATVGSTTVGVSKSAKT